MRKSLFLTLILSLCVADFGAFAATARGNARGGATSDNTATQQNAAPVSARAGARQKVVSAPTTASSASAPVSARAGARQKVASPVATTTAKTSSGSVAARAATKKALSMGTKVAAATENTAVSQECQNAYYGCMDAFCMLDNAAGGRCQCSDRSAELDAVMDEIMRLDEQSARIATEGVEQIQMGEYADQINNRAKSVESGIVSSKTGSSVASSKKSSSSTTRSLDLSIFSTNNLFDAEEDEDGVFAEQGSSSINAMDEIQGKTGDALLKGAAKICTAQVPAECKSSLAVLQTAYVSKVKSDCIGYENALKQQRSASQQKLLTAQKAIRDAALDEVRRQNTYETAGECAVAFAQCMQTTAECGSDYTGCVTLAAAENVKNNSKGSKAKQTTIKGVVAGADITIAATTMESLLAKKEICASVTKQCVNANKNDAVWNVFLRNAAPALKSAELIAEQNLRSNCIPAAAECFKNACKSQFGEDDESYDMCLSNPATYKSLCKVQLEPCLEATGGSYDNPEESSLWNGLVAMLNSMKVDACTKEIKDCLLSEDRCGKDFSNCIGLDTSSIGRMCPVEKLTACVTDGRYAKRTVDKNGMPVVENEDEIRSYIAQIAQGLALNIENNFAKVCQNAAEAALVKACGDGGQNDDETSTCPNLNLNFNSLKNRMYVRYQDSSDEAKYYDSLDEYVNAKKLTGAGLKNLFNLKPTIVGKMSVYDIKYTGKDDEHSDYFGITGASDASTNELLSEINSQYSLLVEQIKADPKVTYCMTGRQVQGFNGNYFGKSSVTADKEGKIKRDNNKTDARFPHLLDATEKQLASQVLNTVFNKYNDEYSKASENLNDAYDTLAKRVADYVSEAELDEANKEACELHNGVSVGYIDGFWYRSGWDYRHVYTAQYDASNNSCFITRITYWCQRGPRVWNTKQAVEGECAIEHTHDPLTIQYPSSKQ